MTIERGEAWGRPVPRPADLVTFDDDASLGAALAAAHRCAGGPPVSVRGGDLARTLGIDSGGAHRDPLNELPLDLVEVRLDGGDDDLIAAAHVVVRSPRWRGSWWRGPILIVMNVEFLGDWDVAPRGHPNDGRVEVFEVSPAMSIRQRLGARRRARTAAHVPHPQIAKRSVRTASWTFAHPMRVVVDGRDAGTATSMGIEVLADAGVVYA